MKDSSGAEQALRRHAHLLSELAAEPKPATSQVRAALCGAHNRLGGYLLAAQRLDEAEVAFERGVEAARRFCDGDPQDPHLRRGDAAYNL